MIGLQILILLIVVFSRHLYKFKSTDIIPVSLYVYENLTDRYVE
jgi:hypothetical protein